MAKYGRDSIIDIKDILDEYSRDIQDGITEDAIKVAQDGAKELKVTSPKNTGKYRKGWKVDKRSGRGYVHATIYNATDWQLTHLLEQPHTIKNQYGEWGTSTPIKHIEPVEQKCIERFKKDVENIIENGG